MKKLRKRIIFIITILHIPITIAVVIGLVLAMLNQDPLSVQLSGWPTEARLGETVTAALKIRCPWGVRPETAVLRPGAGMVEYGTPNVRRAGWDWRGRDYAVEMQLRPYKPGPGSDGEVTVDFSRVWGAPPAPERVALPAVPVVQPDALSPGGELPLAGKLSEEVSRHGSYWWWAAAALGVIVAVAVWLVRRPKQQRTRCLAPWEVAELEVRELREKVKHNQDLKGCLTRLTDVVREYLEWRFTLRSTRQTTVEFLRDLHRPGSPLNSQQQQQLERFMTAADLVKFAGQEANSMLLNPALDQAEALIEETRPVETAATAEEAKHV